LVSASSGRAIAAQLSARFSVVLVDEFQDTDRVQWTVFERGFSGGTLVTVGDPKQAIYRFRGADVHAYLAAVEKVSAQSLDVNHRSDARLLDGLGRLFEGAELGDPRITFSPVGAAPGAPLDAMGAGAAVQLRLVLPHEDLKNAEKDNNLAMPLVRQVVLADMAARVVDLLDNGKISRADGSATDVTPGDIAVLVPSHAEAANVAEALRRARVPVVRTRTGSVLATAAALQWRVLLAALARPHHAPTVRAAALGWFFGAEADSLGADGNDDELVELQEMCAHHGERMRCVGVAAAYDELKSGTRMLPSLLVRPTGDRDLTDLDHIAELLADRTHGTTSEPAQVLRLLEDLVADDDEHGEDTMRRIESDAAAVQVTTVHGAKGLEYPIVLVPFAFKPRPAASRPYTFVDTNDRRTIDVASNYGWSDGSWNQDARKAAADEETDGDALRLLYVALTRARHRVEVWWACGYRWPTSPLARLLVDRDPETGPILNTNGTKLFDGMKMDDVTARLRQLAQASEGTIDLTEVPERVVGATWTPLRAVESEELIVADRGVRADLPDPAWRRWSFTSLASTLHDAEATIPGDVGVAAESPVSGGADETNIEAELAVETAAAGAAASTDPERAWGLPDGAAGQRFGTFAHTVLEQLDFTSPNLDADLRVLVADRARRAGLRLDEPQVAIGLASAVRAPLGQLFDGRSLADIAPADRLAELTFDMPLAAPLGADATGRRARLPAAAVTELLLAALPEHDPARPCLLALPRELQRVDIAGWMYGSIDAVFRITGGQGDRFVIVDYKTNRLHVPGADPAPAYRPNELAAAMTQHHYVLQATIYLVALHRYLRWRLGASYDPDQHLGGAAYLFLRGMGSGPETSDGGAPGVFAWRPPSAAIVAVDRFFADGTTP
jgi:exodeoxyribonuclease V beta subunit